MTNLKKVTIEFDYVIYCTEHDDPYEIAQKYFRESVNDMTTIDPQYTVEDYNPADGTITGWDEMCFTYGGPNKRIREILENEKRTTLKLVT